MPQAAAKPGVCNLDSQGTCHRLRHLPAGLQALLENRKPESPAGGWLPRRRDRCRNAIPPWLETCVPGSHGHAL